MSVQMLTVVYGEKHIEMFRKGTLKSLAFRKNRSAFYAHKICWNIFTDDKAMDYVARLCDVYFPEGLVKVRPMSDLRAFTDPLLSAIVWQISECLSLKQKLILAPPDTIFGDGTIANLIKVGREKGSCVVVPHPRANPTLLNELVGDVSNDELVNLCWQNLHRSWINAETGHVAQNSFVGGVSWQKIHHGLYSVIHRLPTIYMADFIPSDLDYFKAQISFGAWDHTFPATIIPTGRQRYVASSDLAFVVEITDPEKNIPPVWPGDVDEFWKEHEHNKINRQVISVFRGESARMAISFD